MRHNTDLNRQDAKNAKETQRKAREEERLSLNPAPSTLHPLEAGRLATGGKTLSLIGSVQADAQATLSAKGQPTRIAAVMVHEGDTVRRGQALVQLDDKDIAAQARAAQAGVDAARAQWEKAQLAGHLQVGNAEADVSKAQINVTQALTKLQQAKLARDAARADNRSDLQTAQEAVRKAKLALETAHRDLATSESLAQVGGVSRNDLEGARTKVTIAQSDLATAQDQAKRAAEGPSASSEPYRVALAEKDVETAQTGLQQAQDFLKLAKEAQEEAVELAAQDVRSARAALNQAQAQAAGALATQQSSRLLSPLDGVAASVQARAGETAQPGSPLVSLVSLANLRVEALVPGRELPLLRVGQTANIRVDTQPGKVFPATISEIARVAEPDGRTFRVKFRFRSPTQRPTRPSQTARIVVQLI
jgi:HlyD family secretion protein